MKSEKEPSRVWTKKLGQRHYTRDGMTETLCGVPMLGNNYADVIPESQQTECEECLKVLEKENSEEEKAVSAAERSEASCTDCAESREERESANTDIKKLKEIQSKMVELLEEAEYIVKINASGNIYERAKAYWIAHIKTALLNETEYVGKSMVTMEDTISEIEKKLNDEEEDS